MHSQVELEFLTDGVGGAKRQIADLLDCVQYGAGKSYFCTSSDCHEISTRLALGLTRLTIFFLKFERLQLRNFMGTNNFGYENTVNLTTLMGYESYFKPNMIKDL